ncbi:hypothetical protein, partial [Nocardia farcinica]|uniref:hypothetical protein n=1 Tax=Nocardia farcinica TaxID=37329 RepID=UPI0034DB5C15
MIDRMNIPASVAPVPLVAGPALSGKDARTVSATVAGTVVSAASAAATRSVRRRVDESDVLVTD